MADIIILKGQGQYNALEYFADNLNRAFQAEGAESMIFDLVKMNYSTEMLINFMKKGKPKLFIGFNTNGFMMNGKLDYYKYFNASHLSILVDHPRYHIHGMDLSYKDIYISCTDTERVLYLKNEVGFQNSFLLFHGVSKYIEPNYSDKYEDIVFFGSIGDYEELRMSWKDKYSQEVNKLLDTALEIGICNSFMSIDSIIDFSLKYYNIQIGDNEKSTIYQALYIELEQYLRNFHRRKFLGSVKNSNMVVYGNGVWEKYFANSKNVSIRHSVNMEEAIKIMRRSKMTLNCTTSLTYNGSHERPLMAAMAGSLVVSNYSPFFELAFEDGALMTNFLDIDSLDERIHEILNNDNLRIEMAQKARTIVSENHTWNNRARQVLEMLD